MLRKLFYLINFSLLAFFLLAIRQDARRGWKKYQSRYYRMEIARLEQELAQSSDPGKRERIQEEIRRWRSMGLQIRQIILRDFDRVDRCITCHVGMDPFANPSLTNSFTENPYQAHPGKLSSSHPFPRYGCTLCHQGQGLATEVAAAHGAVRHWERPLLKPPYLAASCARCHVNFEELPGAKAAALGKDLFDKLGCVGCHAVNGEGGAVSVDLGDVADKPLGRVDFSYTGLAREEWSVKNWIELHLTRDPMEIVPNDPQGKFGEPIPPSGMPPFYRELQPSQAQALTAYLLSLSHESVPHEYYVYASPKPKPRFANPVEHGRYVFHKYGCQGCHGIGGARGVRNFNALGPDQTRMDQGAEPTLTKVVGTYTREELKEKIRNGVPSSAVVKFNPEGPIPPLYMPPWKDKIQGRELEDLVTYLLSIAEKGQWW